MTNKTLHIILFLWFGIIWATPNSSVPKTITEETVHSRNLVAKDTLFPKETDTVKTKKLDQNHLAHLRQLAVYRSTNYPSGSIRDGSLPARTARLKNASYSLKNDRSNTVLPENASRSPKNIPLNTDQGNSASNENEISTKTFRSFPSLDKKLSENRNFNFSLANRKPEFTREFIASNYPNEPESRHADRKGKESDCGGQVSWATLSMSSRARNLLELPVGLRKKDSTSQNTVELAITEVRFTPQYAEFKAWAKMTIPQKGEERRARTRTCTTGRKASNFPMTGRLSEI